MEMWALWCTLTKGSHWKRNFRTGATDWDRQPGQVLQSGLWAATGWGQRARKMIERGGREGTEGGQRGLLYHLLRIRHGWRSYPFLTNIHQYLLCKKVTTRCFGGQRVNQTLIWAYKTLKNVLSLRESSQPAWGLKPECPCSNYQPHHRPSLIHWAQVNIFCLDFAYFLKVAEYPYTP